MGYMSTNIVFAAVQNRVLKNPVLERLLEIPPVHAGDKTLRRAVRSPMLLEDMDKIALAGLVTAGGKGHTGNLTKDTILAPQIMSSERPVPRNLTPGRGSYRNVEDIVQDPKFTMKR